MIRRESYLHALTKGIAPERRGMILWFLSLERLQIPIFGDARMSDQHASGMASHGVHRIRWYLRGQGESFPRHLDRGRMRRIHPGPFVIHWKNILIPVPVVLIF